MSGLPEIAALTGTAVSIAFLHTLLGPDHYVPFIAMARAGKWPRRKTLWVTFLCGIGHVAGSVILGMAGAALGIAVTRLEVVENFRGRAGAWFLIAFGMVYFLWGMRRALGRRGHEHWHAHEEGVFHTHPHVHQREHAHVHEGPESKLTPWVLFSIFVFGPCEPLIPLLMYPAARHSLAGAVLITLAFAMVTVFTMLGMVQGGLTGIRFLRFGRLEKFTPALAGASVLLCGVAIQFLGL